MLPLEDERVRAKKGNEKEENGARDIALGKTSLKLSSNLRPFTFSKKPTQARRKKKLERSARWN